MEDAFWSGVLSYLCTHSPPQSWKDVLRTLHFDSTDWDFSWKVSLHGQVQSKSKNLAISVMNHIFRKRRLPEGTQSLADLLRGDGAQFELEAFYLTPTGRRSTSKTKTLKVRRGATVSFPIEDRVGIRLLHPSLNIQEIRVTDKQAPPGTLKEYKETLKGGLILDESSHKNPLELLFTLSHYGGVASTADVRVNWRSG